MAGGRVETVELRGAMLRRGFWLYVWEATPRGGTPLLYVGRTGDNSTPNAQSPFVRMGQHLGFAKNSNMLRKHLRDHRVEPELCKLKLVAYGPILEEAKSKTMQEHMVLRNVVGALEKRLAEDLCAAGYRVMNEVRCRWDLDRVLYRKVKHAFRTHFPAL